MPWYRQVRRPNKGQWPVNRLPADPAHQPAPADLDLPHAVGTAAACMHLAQLFPFPLHAALPQGNLTRNLSARLHLKSPSIAMACVLLPVMSLFK